MHGLKDSNLRPIRSFVLREGRFTPGQIRAYTQLWSTYGRDFIAGEIFDPATLFATQQPVYLEIGFGNGETLLHLAETYPERNFLGIEVHRPGIGHLLLNLEHKQLTNVKVLRHDAVEVINNLQPSCLAGIYILFPDPWPKTRHHKRRLIQPEFATVLAQKLQPNGFLHLATDWEDYAQWMLLVLNACPYLTNSDAAGGFVPRLETRNLTRFELRGQRLGHQVHDLLFLVKTSHQSGSSLY